VLDPDTLDHPVSPTDVSGTLHLVGDDARLWLVRRAKLRKRIATLDYVISEPPGPIVGFLDLSIERWKVAPDYLSRCKN
jgi:hypothetical protein